MTNWIEANTGLFTGFAPTTANGTDLETAVTQAIQSATAAASSAASASNALASLSLPALAPAYGGYFLHVNVGGTAYEFHSPAQVLADLGAAPLASPFFTGVPKAPNPSTGDSSQQIATTSYVQGQGYATTAWVTSQGYVNTAGAAAAAPVQSVAGRTGPVTLAVADVSGAAPLASPFFTGVPKAPNPSTGDSSQQVATTAFVRSSAHQSCAFMYANAAQSLPITTYNTLALNTVLFDADGLASTTSHGFVVKTAGVYRVDAFVNMTVGTAGQGGVLMVYVNGTERLRGMRCGSPAGDTGFGVGVSGLLSLSANDTVTFVYFAYAGATATSSAGANAHYACISGPIY